MSLRLNYKSIHDYKNYVYITDDEGNITENPITVSIGFTMMAVDIGRITESNVIEFYIRQKLLYTLRGHEPISLEDIRRNIGLSANVMTEPDRETWLSRVLNEGILREWSYAANRELESLKNSDYLYREA